jgi:hypothetical protein
MLVATLQFDMALFLDAFASQPPSRLALISSQIAFSSQLDSGHREKWNSRKQKHLNQYVLRRK